jgi:hypothetical protein
MIKASDEVLKKRRQEQSREYHLKHRDKILRKMRRRYLRNRAYRLARQKKYYRDHREKIISYVRQWTLKNSAHVKAAARARRLKNIHRVREIDRRRSKRRYQDPVGRAKIEEWRKRNAPRLRERLALKVLELKKKFGGKCRSCGYEDHPEILEFDHKTPLSRLGKSGARSFRDRLFGAMKYPEAYDLLYPNCHAIKSSFEKQKAWSNVAWKYWSRRFQILAMFDSKCCKCGYNENVLALEFDHKNGLGGRKRQPAVCDVPKHPNEFQLLCANCHTIKTLKVDRQKVGHSA